MRFKAYGIVLGLFFALGLVFSFGVEAFADHADGTGKEAGDVTTTSEADVEAFLDHIIGFYNDNYDQNASSDEQNRGVTTYGRAIREEGVYKNSANNMYSMGINEKGFITNHAGYPGLYGYEFKEMAQDSEVASTVGKLITDSDINVNACDTYGDEGRVACATKVDSPSGIITVIAGLHHEADDSAFQVPDCTGLNDLAAMNTNHTNATEVNDKDSLKEYVKSVIDLTQKLFTKVGTEVGFANPELAGKIFGQTATPAEVDEFGKLTRKEIFGNIACFSNGDPDNGPVINHGDIYSFVMIRDANTTVLFNGLNPDLNGLDLQVNDPNPNPVDGERDKNIAELVREAVLDSQGNPKSEGDFVEYHWLKPGDTAIPNWFENKVVPGNSHKISYVEAADLNTSGIGPAAVYIFGSGIYPEDMMPEDMMPEDMMPEDMMPEDMMPEDMMPEDMMPASDDDDDGCAIAGAGHTSQGALLNMFLIASVLFSVVFLRRRV